MRNSNGKGDINAKKAWDITTGSHDIVVAAIDTGIEHTHPDLKNNMWVNKMELEGQPDMDNENNKGALGAFIFN